MKKIINISEAADLSNQQKALGRRIVLAGGCFDILHSGHIFFLDSAKKSGDILFILLESDAGIKKRKGAGRPVNSQKNRAIVLSALKSVDYVVTLKGVTKDKEYDKLIVQIKPGVIAITKGDRGIKDRLRQCAMIGAKLERVRRVKDLSTTNLLN